MNFRAHLYNSFSKLIEEHGFSKNDEIDTDGSYSIEYSSKSFVIRIEKYRRELYVVLYRPGNEKSKANLFNLLQYINKDILDKVTESNYFRDETDLEESYKKQLNHISSAIYENYDSINDFYSSPDLDLRLEDLKTFMINRYPNLFGKQG